jgi:hypothetical protein
MESHAANLKLGSQRRIVLYAIQMHMNLTEATPILTGKAKAEWQVGLNIEPTSELLPDVKSPTRVDWQAYAQAAELEISQFQSGQTIYIVNNASYIADLNAGSSVQAAANFVQVAVDRAGDALRATL